VTDEHFKGVERDVDAAVNRIEELQNWIDIYMPLRFQH